mgnify:FL=1
MEDTKSDILFCGAPLLSQNGYETVSSGEISAELDIQQTALYKTL